MKKSTLIASFLGTISMIFFALGMCMALLPEWNAFRSGVILGASGIILGIITFFLWRKLEHKAPVRLNGRNVLLTLIGI